MTRKSRCPTRHDDPDKPDHPPAGAALDRYEASMMLMIASRALEAYDGDSSPPHGRQPRSRKAKKH